MGEKRVLWGVNVTSFVLFSGVLWSVLEGNMLLVIDRWINALIAQVRLVWLDPLVKWVTDMNGLAGATLFSFLLVVFFARKGWSGAIGFYLIVSFGAAILFAAIKSAVGRIRPDEAVIEVGGFSYPSGHTTMATAMAFALYFIFSQKSRGRELRGMFFFMALGWACLIAWTRVYLGVHWFSDVVGGFLLGVWWVTFVRLLWPNDVSW